MREAVTSLGCVVIELEHCTLYRISKGYTMEMYKNMNNWEIEKALYLQKVAIELNIELDDMAVAMKKPVLISTKFLTFQYLIIS